MLWFTEWCKQGQYVCANAKQCIDVNRVCDGAPDCPLGDDEKSCVALANHLEDNEVIPYNDEGMLNFCFHNLKNKYLARFLKGFRPKDKYLQYTLPMHIKLPNICYQNKFVSKQFDLEIPQQNWSLV